MDQSRPKYYTKMLQFNKNITTKKYYPSTQIYNYFEKWYNLDFFFSKFYYR